MTLFKSKYRLRIEAKIAELFNERVDISLKLKGMNIPSLDRAKLSVRDADLRDKINLLTGILKGD